MVVSVQVKEIEARLDGIVHAKTQRHETGFDLTASTIHGLSAPGRIDFGGGELTPPEIHLLDTVKRDPDDDYGWWELEEGTYLLTFNETLNLDAGERLLLHPRTALVEQGVDHPTLIVRELPEVPIEVPEAGARIKENARVSTLVPLERQG